MKPPTAKHHKDYPRNPLDACSHVLGNSPQVPPGRLAMHILTRQIALEAYQEQEKKGEGGKGEDRSQKKKS